MTERPDREHDDSRRAPEDGPAADTGPAGTGSAFRPRVIGGGAAQDDTRGQTGPGDAPSPSPSLDEDGLRRLLHESVQDLEPDPAALEQLRRAVPARRARHRQILVGVAAAALLGGAALPALLHTDLISDGQTHPMHVAGHEHSQGLKGDGGSHDLHGPGANGTPTGPGHTQGPAGTSSFPSAGESAGPDPNASLGAVSPSCDRTQLGDGTATTESPDAQGRVYGTFRVVNTSSASCTVMGEGLVVATAQGGARADEVQVVDHTRGDDAPGLPDPATAPDQLVLKPGAAYVVKFAWVPAAGGGPTGCSTSPTTPPATGTSGSDGGGGGSATQSGFDSPVPSGSPGGTGDTSTSSDGGTGAGTGSGGDGSAGGDQSTGGDQNGGPDGGDPQPTPSVALSHTPDMGGPPAAGTVLEGACAGTVYRTGVLPATS